MDIFEMTLNELASSFDVAQAANEPNREFYQRLVAACMPTLLRDYMIDIGVRVQLPADHETLASRVVTVIKIYWANALMASVRIDGIRYAHPIKLAEVAMGLIIVEGVKLD